MVDALPPQINPALTDIKELTSSFCYRRNSDTAEIGAKGN